MPPLAAFRCPFLLLTHCFLGRWICLPVSEGFNLVWWCRLFDYSTYIPFCVHWHGSQCLRQLVQEGTKHFFIKYLSFCSLNGLQLVASWEIDGETYIRERTYCSRSFFLEPGDANTCTPLQARQRRLWSAACPTPDSNSLPLPKSDRVVLLSWSPSGYTPVVPDSPDHALLYTNHNVTACQSARGH